MDNTKVKLEMFRQAIDAQAEAEMNAVREAAEARSAAAGKAKTEFAANEALKEIKLELNKIKSSFRKEMSKTDFETKKAVLAHRNDLINGFFEELREKVAEFTKTAQYEDYLKRSLEQVRTQITLDSKTVIYGMQRDTERLKKLTSCEVKEDAQIHIGGICACCTEKKVYLDLTLDKALCDEREAFSEKSELRL